jgi:formate hydrogenlyase subunit 6/NADH:ubiquinone oxidoreductase subunit I
LCGYCVEASPKDAITHGYNFELSVYNRADLLKTKDDLLITKQVQSRNYRVASSDEDVDSEYKEV